MHHHGWSGQQQSRHNNWQGGNIFSLSIDFKTIFVDDWIIYGTTWRIYVGSTSSSVAKPVRMISIFIYIINNICTLSRFSINYKNRIWKHEVMLKKSERSAVQQSHQINGVVVGNGVSVPVSENNIISVTHNVSTKNQITPIG